MPNEPEKLKSASEWVDEMRGFTPKGSLEEVIEAIKLNAYKAGMRKAVETSAIEYAEALSNGLDNHSAHQYSIDFTITLAETITEKEMI